MQAEQLAGSLLNEDDGDDTEKYTVGEAIDHIGASGVAAGVVLRGRKRSACGVLVEPERVVGCVLACVARTSAHQQPLLTAPIYMRPDTCLNALAAVLSGSIGGAL